MQQIMNLQLFIKTNKTYLGFFDCRFFMFYRGKCENNVLPDLGNFQIYDMCDLNQTRSKNLYKAFFTDVIKI